MITELLTTITNSFTPEKYNSKIKLGSNNAWYIRTSDNVHPYKDRAKHFVTTIRCRI